VTGGTYFHDDESEQLAIPTEILITFGLNTGHSNNLKI
jgi:hypothetical protein